MRKVLSLLFALAAVALVADPALAQTLTNEAAAAGAAAAKASYFKWVVITAGFAMAIASSACAMGQSRAVTMAVEAIARQPSAAGKIQTVMIIGLALIESLAIYVLLIGIIVFFVKPFDASVLGL